MKKKKEFQSALLKWYGKHQRRLPWREHPDPFHIWVSEVMLQQTQVKTVVPYFLRFITRFPTLRQFAEADLEAVLKMWEGLGYYARARNLHKSAVILSRDEGAVVPDDLTRFIQLPGVGDYIGSAVQSIAFGHPHAVVDGNVKRVLARVYCSDNPVNKPGSHNYFQIYANDLLDKKNPGIWNQAVMELGALVCRTPKPLCGSCPVSGFCQAFLSGKTDRYPVRVKAKKVPTYSIATGIVRKKKKFLITRRKLSGLLGGLWEFPGGKLEGSESAPSACIREIREETGITAEITSHLTTIRHAYTHFKIRMDVFTCNYIQGRVRLNGPIDFKWITPKEIDRFAFPKANHKFIPLIKDWD